MGKHIEYSTEKELDAALDKILRTDPHALSLADHVNIAACFVTRMDDDQTTIPGKGDPVVIKKIGPDIKVLLANKADFLIVVDYHFWQTAPKDTRQGHLGHALSRIKVETTENGVKVGLRKWEIVENISTIRTYGLYTETLALVGDMVGTLRKQLDMSQHALEKEQTKMSTTEDEPEADEPPREPPRATETVRTKPKSAQSENGSVRRPARKIPPDPAPETAEPEPEE